MNEERRYVRLDEHGVRCIGNSRVMLEAIVAGFEPGHSLETLQQQYPIAFIGQGQRRNARGVVARQR